MAFSIERHVYIYLLILIWNYHRPTLRVSQSSFQRHTASILSKKSQIPFVLITLGQFCPSQGSPIRQILQLSLESSSFCLGINHIDNTLFGLWYSGSREFPKTVRPCFIGISGPLSGLYFCVHIFPNYFKWPFEISNVLFFTANYIESLPIAYNCLLLADTLCQLSHLLDGLKTNLSHWFYFSFAVAFSQ